MDAFYCPLAVAYCHCFACYISLLLPLKITFSLVNSQVCSHAMHIWQTICTNYVAMICPTGLEYNFIIAYEHFMYLIGISLSIKKYQYAPYDRKLPSFRYIINSLRTYLYNYLLYIHARWYCKTFIRSRCMKISVLKRLYQVNTKISSTAITSTAMSTLPRNKPKSRESRAFLLTVVFRKAFVAFY